ncbi:ATP-dependent DNA ligase [Streptomyces pseudogriseolus]|uniref:ATP-dependent DNA ligase n=1 Tax=Streptomyces pseudogriseolus TaxID=36817 RepID=UPI003FA21D40
MVLIPPVQPMLAEAHSELPPERALPGGLAFEQRPDGYRALLFAGPGGHAHLQSRNGSDLSPAFPEIAAADRALRVPLVLDGELVVTAEGRLDFGQLHQRALRRGADARLAARDHPAYLIVFDILDTADGPLLDEPYRARRALLEEPFAHGVPADPFVLCSATTDRATAEDWLNPAWGTAGIEGIVVKGLAQRYQPGRIKVRGPSQRGGRGRRRDGPGDRAVDAAAGPLRRPRPAPVHRPDGTAVGDGPAGGRRPSLPGRRQPPLGAAPLSAGSGAREAIDHRPVQPDIVVEFAGDTAVDAGRYRHPLRARRRSVPSGPSWKRWSRRRRPPPSAAHKWSGCR